MPKEIDFSSYECDCGYQLYFCTNTIREMMAGSYRKQIGISGDDNRHAAFFHKGQWVGIFCPKIGQMLPATPAFSEPSPPVTTNPEFTRRQGQVLAFIHLYTKLHRQSPAEADIAEYFRITPPSAHQMVVTLERKGLIERRAGEPRSINLRITPDQLPPLE